MATTKQTAKEEFVNDVTGEIVAGDVAGAAELDGIAGTVDIAGEIEALSAGQVRMYNSVDASDFEGQQTVAAALSSSVPLDENLGKEIQLADIIVYPVRLTGEDGAIIDAPRAVLIDVDGKAYHAVSNGVLSGIKQILGTFDEPKNWKAPVPVTAERTNTRSGYKAIVLRVTPPAGRKSRFDAAQ